MSSSQTETTNTTSSGATTSTASQRKDPDALCETCDWARNSGFAGCSGPEDGKILVVGEAPGRVEIDSGLPFTGPSGILLDKVLAHHRINRDEIRFTNVVACHPPFGQGASVTPPKSVIAACKPRLIRELSSSSRDVIIGLGNTANKAITDSKAAITNDRVGPPKHLKIGGNEVDYIATVHPAACLRSGDMFPWLVRDIGKVANRHIFTNWVEPKYKAYDTEREALSVIRQLHDFPLLVLDIETDVEKDTSFTHPKAVLCIGISYAPNRAVVLGERALGSPHVQRKLKELIDAKKIVCHNGKYDLQVLLRVGTIDCPRLYADTMLASYVLDERPGGHSLGGLASEILGAPDWKGEVKPYTKDGQSYRNIPTDLLHKYNAWDAAQTFLLWDYFEKRLEKEGLRRVHDMLVGFSITNLYIEFDGIQIDQDYLQVLETRYIQKIVELEKALSPWVANPRSWQQVLVALKKFGFNPPSTNVKTLVDLLKYAKGDAVTFLLLMLEIRKVGKLYGTYIKGNKKVMLDGRVYPSYLLHGTVFGRLSAKNPNIHNQPRGPELRSLYVPAEGNVFVQADFSQAELRVIAVESGDTFLTSVFRDATRDIHNEVSDTLYGVGNWTKEQRVRTKAFVFGSAYGREAFSIAQEFSLPQQEAERIQRGFFDLIPDTMRWRQEVQDQVFKQGKALQTHFGRKRRFHLITRENKGDIAKEALAFIPQSSASDVCQYSASAILAELGWSEHSPRLRNTVHDSILVECAKGDAEEVGRMMSRVCSETAAEVYSDKVPFVADWESGPNWGHLE